MNRDEVMALQAGRELDLLISQIVFGHSVDEWNKRFFANKTGYSTDISAAWEIVEKLNLSIAQKDMSEFPPRYLRSRWLVDISPKDNGRLWLAWGDTAPLAICRAALLIVTQPNQVSHSSKPAVSDDAGDLLLTSDVKSKSD